MSYTIAQVRDQLTITGGDKVRFVLDRMRDSGRFHFDVKNLGGGRVMATERGVSVDSGANSVAEAARWAMNGLREWAGYGVPVTPGGNGEGSTYFAEIVRDWAKSGQNAKSVPTCLGSTLDLLYLFSADTSQSHPTDFMYPVSSLVRTDLFNIYCWVFASKWAADGPQPTRAAVPMNSRLGLHHDLWDTHGRRPNQEDQTHHFAGYFYFGARYRYNIVSVLLALEHTGDVVNHFPDPPAIINAGDVMLGLLAAQWGVEMNDSPGYLGHRVAESLRTCGDWPFGPPGWEFMNRIREAQHAP